MQEGFPQIVNIQDDILRLGRMGILEPLLADKTTGGNILWATDAYAERGPQYEPTAEITASLITGPDNAGIIQTRARKAFEEQSARTRQRAEVYTPLWIVKKMCDHIDEVWFKRKDGFYKTVPETNRIYFNKNRTWTAYIKSTRLEISCGEAPFLVSRYDAPTGSVVAIQDRVGILDRKLRVVSENTNNEADWMKWAQRAFQSTYGFELQGDSLLIARVNALTSFIEYYSDRWGHLPKDYECKTIADIIAWNIWEMDGLTLAVPYRTLEIEYQEVIQGFFVSHMTIEDKPKPCRIMDWGKRKAVEYMGIKKDENNHVKLDFIIGNPPYQEETKDTSDKPVYDRFMDGAYEVADKVELIHPARFLFNAGKTPKSWNEKILHDEHFKVLSYMQDSGTVFPGIRITGGVAITYRDVNARYSPVEVFSQFDEVRSLSQKMLSYVGSSSIQDIMILQNRLNLNVLYNDYPEAKSLISSNGNERRIVSSAFNKLPIFSDEQESDKPMIRIFGLEGTGNKRTQKWADAKYIEDNGNLYRYKVMVSKSNGGAGTLCDGAVRIIAEPFLLAPSVGYTQSFIGIGSFDTEVEANTALKYLKTKFTRCLLGILKITQDNPPEKWRFIPIQNFTDSSDIDWTKSIPEIDQQLYKKYGLDEKEIEFIESHVKEMT